MLPPTQLSDRRTYGPENLPSAMQKDFFDSIDPELPSSTAVFCDALRGIAINHKRVKQLTLRRPWATLATPRRGEDTRARIGAAVWTD